MSANRTGPWGKGWSRARISHTAMVHRLIGVPGQNQSGRHSAPANTSAWFNLCMACLWMLVAGTSINASFPAGSVVVVTATPPCEGWVVPVVGGGPVVVTVLGGAVVAVVEAGTVAAVGSGRGRHRPADSGLRPGVQLRAGSGIDRV